MAHLTRRFVRSDGPNGADSTIVTSGPVGWAGGRTPIPPFAVVDSYADVISFRTHRSGDGLRRPQVGGLHCVLGYWASSMPDPTIVVMPTGTGKTKTMRRFLPRVAWTACSSWSRQPHPGTRWSTSS